MGGSAGGLLMGAVNSAPEFFRNNNGCSFCGLINYKSRSFITTYNWWICEFGNAKDIKEHLIIFILTHPITI